MSTLQIEIAAGIRHHRQQSMQIEAGRFANDSILKAGGVKRIHDGWYTCHYNGAVLDCSTVTSAKRNKKGELRYA